MLLDALELEEPLSQEIEIFLGNEILGVEVAGGGQEVGVEQKVGAGGWEEQGEDVRASGTAGGGRGRLAEMRKGAKVDRGDLGVTIGKQGITLRFRARKLTGQHFSLFLFK